jgi:cytochrome bd-type quinol oxidase subunit 1
VNALDLSRWQFGITTVYHFIFVPLTIGLSIVVAVMQTYLLSLISTLNPHGTVQGITRQSVSPGVTASSVIISLAVFTLLYGFLAAIAGWLAIRQVKDGAPALAEGSAGEPCTPRSTPWLTRPRAAAGC